MTHAHDVGYDLATVLMVRADDGAPVAPACVALTTADGVLSTREQAPTVDIPHIDQVLPAMQYVRDADFGATVVNVIDREADSVNHWRQWSTDGHLALVRADNRKVLCDGKETSLVAIAEKLSRDDAFKDAGEVLYHGRKAQQFVAEVEVVLHRPGKRNEGKKKVEIPGPPLPLRLVVTEVRDFEGQVLAQWLLLTNVPAALADTATIALWYYFRWRIESMHKLIKSAGWQLENWLQRSGDRILKKLLLAFGACAAIWALERRHDKESNEMKELLMTLSGRQTKRRRPITTSGMLAGLEVLQSAIGPLARLGPDKLKAMMEDQLPQFAVRKLGLDL